MSSLFDRQFVIVMGKGGVGRTSVALALGRAAADRGKRVLVCLCNAPPRYADLVGKHLDPTSPTQIGPNLFGMNIEPKASQEEYGLKVVSNRMLHRIIFNSRIVRAFLDAVPGLAEWAMLGKATFHALSEDHGQPEYDLVLYDSPATGHGLDILHLPRAIASAVPTGRIRAEALERVQLLENPFRCEVVPVTLAEELPVNETRELVAGLMALDLSVERVIVNMVQGDALSAPAAELAARHRGDTPDWLLPAVARLSAEERQRTSLDRLSREVGLPQIHLPLLDERPLGPGGLALLAAELDRKIS